MSCEDVRQRLLEAGDYPSAADLDHLRRCTPCQDWHQGQREVSELLNAGRYLVPPAQLQRELPAAVLARLPARGGRRALSGRWMWGTAQGRRAVLAAAAVLAAVVLVTRGLERRGPSETRPPAAVTEKVDLVVQSAQIDGRDARVSVLDLPQHDTVVIWLD